VQVFGVAQFYQNGAGVRSDKTFKRFLRNIGTSYKDINEKIMGTDGIDKVEGIYFRLNQSKLIFTPKTKADVTAKLNSNYLYDMSVPFINTDTIYYYSQGRVANEIIATLPNNTDIINYQFANYGGVSETTSDGFYSIDSDGNIRITSTGVAPILSDPYDVYSSTINPPTNKVSHTGSSNHFSYTVIRTHLDNTTSSVDIVLIVKRDYIDVQITVGGQYTNTMKGFTAVDSGIPDMFNDLTLLRTTLEANSMQYLAGVYTGSTPTYSNIVNLGSSSLSMKVADIAFNEDWGCDLDTLAVLDDGTIFECIAPVIGEVIELTPIAVQYNGTNTTLFNMSYTYTKRYKVKSVAVETSTLISNIDTIAHSFIVSTTKVFSINTVLDTNNATADTTIKDAVKALQTDYPYEDNDIFYYGYLRVDAFNAMTATEFHKLFIKCFDTIYTTKKGKWWSKLLAVIIIIIAVVIVVLSCIFPPMALVGYDLAIAMYALAMGMLFITIAGMMYARYVGDEAGMKMIAGATQVIGIALAIVSICNGYVDAMNSYEAIGAMSSATASEVAAAGGEAAMQSFITSAALDTAVSAITLAVGVASFGVNVLGMGGEREKQIVNTASAVLGAYQRFNNFTSGFSAPSVGPVQNITNFVNMAASGYRGYMAIDSVGTKTATEGAKDQAVPEDGIESVYLLETRTVAFDAIEALDEKMQMEYGLNKTDGIKQKQYL
jgi:hypothetical protein